MHPAVFTQTQPRRPIFGSPKPVDATVLNIGIPIRRFQSFVSAMLSLSLSQYLFPTALVLFFAGTRVDAENIIVDDANTSKIGYSSGSGWQPGNTCAGCFAQPDRTQAYDGTWHECAWYRCMLAWY